MGSFRDLIEMKPLLGFMARLSAASFGFTRRSESRPRWNRALSITCSFFEDLIGIVDEWEANERDASRES